MNRTDKGEAYFAIGETAIFVRVDIAKVSGCLEISENDSSRYSAHIRSEDSVLKRISLWKGRAVRIYLMPV